VCGLWKLRRRARLVSGAGLRHAGGAPELRDFDARPAERTP
jgi:hypothetical protein